MSSQRWPHLGLWPLLFFILFGWSRPTLQAQSDPKASDEVTRILFVFDASNSMNAFWDRRRKWDVARELLSASLDSLIGIENLELGLRVYGHGTKHVKGQQDCDDTELVVPIGPGRNLIIQQELKKLKAQGTTPIARSLLKAADDFAATSGPGKNVILLITDGIEACDEDPCAVSRALQAQGIVIKPFIIGIGLEEQYRSTFQCVGRYFDASEPEGFADVLDIVIDQAIHRTSAQVNLLNSKGEPIESNLPFEVIEKKSGHPVIQAVHTLNSASVPDTLVLNPVPVYDVVVHTLPPVIAEDITLTPRIHNHISIEAPTGFLDLSLPNPRSVLSDLSVRVTLAGEDCSTVFHQNMGSRQRYLMGTYDVEFPTLPPVLVQGVKIGDKRIVPIGISEPGLLRLNTSSMGYGGLFLETEEGRQMVVPFNGTDPSGSYHLQPGRYVMLFRAKRAQTTELSVTRTFDLRSGGMHTIEL